ncbi:hypothetical protein D6B99_06460 [Arachidicoccus soli]|uniref:Uncharacterized protein n=1 Tax=Arachidicoccus soli TaxID=2341117 RepID=A0A386HNF5_9BACT|nr:hypothetical protein D6B99_06460 [Arachidicoccus soli]
MEVGPTDQHKKLWKEGKFLNLWVINKTYASRLPIAYKIHSLPYILAHFELKSVKEQQDNATLEIELEEPNLVLCEFGEGIMSIF